MYSSLKESRSEKLKPLLKMKEQEKEIENKMKELEEKSVIIWIKDRFKNMLEN